MANPGAIMQLNMGEGKTRVILPMLALHWADGKRLVGGVSKRTSSLPPVCRAVRMTLAKPRCIRQHGANLAAECSLSCTHNRGGRPCTLSPLSKCSSTCASMLLLVF
jgi:hypothetical protein